MKNMVLAALAALTLGAAVVPAAHASSVSRDRAATLMQRSGAYGGDGGGGD